MENAVAVINMHASRAKLHSRLVRRLLKKGAYKCKEAYFVDDPDDIQDTFKKIVKKNPDTIIVGGGDGTIISTLEWFNNNGYKGNFGLLPLGTANYLARNLEIPLGPRKALKKIATGKVRIIKLAKANDKIFSLMITIGFATQVSENVKVKNKRRLGQLAYITEGLRQLGSHRDFDYKIKFNSKKNISGRAFQIAVFNADVNRQLQLAPGSSLEEDSLRLVIYNSEKRLLFVLFNVLLYIVSFGRIKRGMKSIKSKQFTIETAPAKNVSIDGEVTTKTPLDLSATTEKVKVLL